MSDTFPIAIRMIPVGDEFRYQLVDMRTLATLRPLTFAQAEAIASELVPVLVVNPGGGVTTY